MKLAKNIVIYAGSDLLGRGIGLITSPFTTRLLTPEQYGAIPLLGAVWGMVALAQYGGMDWAYPFFQAQEDQDTRRREILSTATWIATFSFLAIWAGFAVVAVAGPWLGRYAGVSRSELSLFLLGLVPTSLTYWYLYLFRFMHQALPFARINLLGRVGGALLALPLMMLTNQPDRLMIFLGTSFGIQLLALIWAMRDLHHLETWPYERRYFSKDQAWKMARYGALLVPGGMVYATSSLADRLLVGWISGPSEVAILALALSLGAIVTMLKSWFGLVWDPHLVEWLSSRNEASYLPRLQAALIGLSISFFALAALSAIWSHWIIALIYPPYYRAAARLVPFLALGGAFSVLSLVAVATAMIANTPRYHLPVYGCALGINVVVGLLSIPKWGALGAVWGTLAAEIFILNAWILLGKKILKNLNLKWAMAAGLGLCSGLFVLFYRPSHPLSAPGWAEHLLLTGAISLGAFTLLWKKRPAKGWKEIP